MEYVSAVFQSRREAIEFGRKMEKNGARVTAVNAPLSYTSSCGLAIKCRRSDLAIARRVLSSGEYFSFKGFYDM